MVHRLVCVVASVLTATPSWPVLASAEAKVGQKPTIARAGGQQIQLRSAFPRLLTHDQLMALSPMARAKYVNGLRELMVELSGMEGFDFAGSPGRGGLDGRAVAGLEAFWSALGMSEANAVVYYEQGGQRVGGVQPSPECVEELGGNPDLFGTQANCPPGLVYIGEDTPGVAACAPDFQGRLGRPIGSTREERRRNYRNCPAGQVVVGRCSNDRHVASCVHPRDVATAASGRMGFTELDPTCGPTIWGVEPGCDGKRFEFTVNGVTYPTPEQARRADRAVGSTDRPGRGRQEQQQQQPQRPAAGDDEDGDDVAQTEGRAATPQRRGRAGEAVSPGRAARGAGGAPQPGAIPPAPQAGGDGQGAPQTTAGSPRGAAGPAPEGLEQTGQPPAAGQPAPRAQMQGQPPVQAQAAAGQPRAQCTLAQRQCPGPNSAEFRRARAAFDSAANRDGQADCIFSGLPSTYRDGRRGAGRCVAQQQFCLRPGDPASCRGPQGHELRCGQGEAVCNPLLFSVKTDGTPHCVPAQANATRACHQIAKPDNSWPDFSTAFINGLREAWDDMNARIQNICGNSVEGQPRSGRPPAPAAVLNCSACNVIAQRLEQLNSAAGHPCGGQQPGQPPGQQQAPVQPATQARTAE